MQRLIYTASFVASVVTTAFAQPWPAPNPPAPGSDPARGGTPRPAHDRRDARPCRGADTHGRCRVARRVSCGGSEPAQCGAPGETGSAQRRGVRRLFARLARRGAGAEAVLGP